jgi:hypothetical protein
VQRDDIRLGKEVVEGAESGIVRDGPARVEDSHVEGSGAPGNRFPDPPQPDDAERRAAELLALQRLVGPAAAPPSRADEPVTGRDPSAQGQDQTEREIGRCGRGDARRVRDENAAAPAGLDVDEVVARAVVRNDTESGKAVEELLVDALGDDGQRLDVGPGLGRRLVEILDVAELVPGGSGEPACGEDLQRERWRRGLEPPTTGTTTRGSTN